jgi:uncharacterized membrane protein HdeD (DUF308 family)
MPSITQNWWAIALRGVVAIAFGVIAFLFPTIALTALILLFAAYAFVDGIFAVVSGFRRRADGRPDWMLVVGGIVGIVIGVVTAVLPGITALFLLTLIGAWAIVTGIAEIVAAYRMREVIRGEWLLAVNGIVSVVFGLYILFFPGPGALAVIWLIALYALASGVVLVALALRLRARARGADMRQGAAPA